MTRGVDLCPGPRRLLVKAAHGPTALRLPASVGSGFHSVVVKSMGPAGQESDTTRYDVMNPPAVDGVGDDADRTEAETAPVTTSALTYRDSVAGSSRHPERVAVATGPDQRIAICVNTPLDGLSSLQLAGPGTDHSGTVNVLVDGVVQPNDRTGDPLTVDRYQQVPTHTESFLAGIRLSAGRPTVTLVTTTPNAASRDVVDHGGHPPPRRRGRLRGARDA